MGDGNVGVGFGVTPTAVGGSVSSGSRPFTWSVVGGRLPPGLTLDPSFSTMNTLLHGTPTVAGTSTFTIQVEDAAQETAQQAFSITIGTGNLDSLTITRATYNVKRVTLQVAANDPNVDSVLTVFLTGTGHQIGRLNTSGTGSYSGNFVMSLSALNPANITVKSSRGASASSPVTIVRQY
jgi:hypothetical protein